MPGGVNSPVRAFKSVGGQPIVMDSVKGSHMWDIDGNEYIDYVGSWGPAIIGHADDEVLPFSLSIDYAFQCPAVMSHVFSLDCTSSCTSYFFFVNVASLKS